MTEQQIPTIGRIVRYTLAAHDADAINRRRAGAQNLNAAGVTLASQNLGPQIHTGNTVHEGEVYPLVITRTWSDQPGGAINGQVLLDGNDTLWVTSRCGGDEAGQYHWPERVLPDLDDEQALTELWRTLTDRLNTLKGHNG